MGKEDNDKNLSSSNSTADSASNEDNNITNSIIKNNYSKQENKNASAATINNTTNSNNDKNNEKEGIDIVRNKNYKNKPKLYQPGQPIKEQKLLNENDEKKAKAYIKIADTYLLEKKYKKSSKEFQKVIKLNPYSLQGHIGLVTSLEKINTTYNNITYIIELYIRATYICLSIDENINKKNDYFYYGNTYYYYHNNTNTTTTMNNVVVDSNNNNGGGLSESLSRKAIQHIINNP